MRGRGAPSRETELTRLRAASEPWGAMKITYYLEVVSSWCHWAEPAWAALKQQYAGRVEFEWKIALMRPEDFPRTPAELDWYYRRSGIVVRSPYRLSTNWLDVSRAGHYVAASLVAEAGKDFGVSDDRIRLALSHAAVREGRKLGDIEVAVAIGAAAAGLDASKLRTAAESSAVKERVRLSTEEFYAHRIDQRPAFILQDRIGDKAVFSGLVRPEPVAAAIDAMLADVAAYASYEAHFGPPPA